MPSVIGAKASFLHTRFFRGAALQPVCRLTMEGAIVFLQHLHLALILCSGTSYSLCMFACTSAFDGLSGLIPAMQSLSQLSNVSLGGTSGRKTPAGKSSLRKDLSVSGLDVVCVILIVLCVVCHSERDR